MLSDEHNCDLLQCQKDELFLQEFPIRRNDLLLGKSEQLDILLFDCLAMCVHLFWVNNNYLHLFYSQLAAPRRKDLCNQCIVPNGIENKVQSLIKLAWTLQFLSVLWLMLLLIVTFVQQ